MSSSDELLRAVASSLAALSAQVCALSQRVDALASQAMADGDDALLRAQGAPLPNCVGFIDGTLRAICRPTRHQRIVYNGHKRFHGLKFQSVVTPDGIVAHLFGPVVGRVHDARLFNESGLLPILEEHFNVPAPLGPFYLYGDPAYGLNRWVVCPYKGAHITAAQEEFNRRMSSVREAVEWAFGKVVNLFAFVDYKKNLKLGLQQVGSFYIVAVLLTNCHTCLYGVRSQTSSELRPQLCRITYSHFEPPVARARQ